MRRPFAIDEAARPLIGEASSAILRAWGNGWATSERLHTDACPGCIFGRGGRNPLGHYIICSRLRAAVWQAIGCVHPVAVDFWAGVARARAEPSERVVCVRRLVVAAFVFHWARAVPCRSVGTCRQRRISADRLPAREVARDVSPRLVVARGCVQRRSGLGKASRLAGCRGRIPFSPDTWQLREVRVKVRTSPRAVSQMSCGPSTPTCE